MQNNSYKSMCVRIHHWRGHYQPAYGSHQWNTSHFFTYPAVEYHMRNCQLENGKCDIRIFQTRQVGTILYESMYKENKYFYFATVHNVKTYQDRIDSHLVVTASVWWIEWKKKRLNEEKYTTFWLLKSVQTFKYKTVIISPFLYI